MLKKDYLIRQFEEFGKVMALILNFRKRNDLENYEKELANAVIRFTSLQLEKIDVLSSESFQEEISKKDKDLSNDQIKILADLLWEKYINGSIPEEASVSEDQLKKIKFLLQLYQNKLTSNEFNLDVHYKLKLLENMINPTTQQ